MESTPGAQRTGRGEVLRAILQLGAALAVGAAGLWPVAAQASTNRRPARDMVYTFQLSAEQARGYSQEVCVGEEVTYRVRAWLSGRDEAQNRTIARRAVPGVRLTARASSGLRVVSADPAIAATVDDDGRFMEAEVTVKAEGPGMAQLTLRGTLMARYLELQAGVPEEARRQGLRAELSVPVEVIECPLRVSVLERGEIKAGSYFIDLVGHLPPVRLRQSDMDAEVFVASGTMPVVVRQFAPPATVVISVGTRQVEIRAERSGGSYSITVSRGEMTVLGSWIGPDRTVTQAIPFPSPEPIRFSMPENAPKYNFQEPISMPGIYMNGTVFVRRAR